ncbi:PRC-barrel domain-containing protein [Conexibacter sp. S30A1]|uniref:PRC-barrel domain-containing protein n=1 Tax=Conexibacter sp. S30A1 TaxID=2937800 RepID=UPI00200CB336|nr:PRC-barrel domain-containing protein [Conexibacter sp. S30A1]
MDLGAAVSYEVLAAGTPVFSSDGEQIGKVTHVLAAEDEDIFEGIVIGEHAFGEGHRFVDAEQVERIYERGVELNLEAAACTSLPKPTKNPAVMHADPAATQAELHQGRLHRAWNLISGNY